MTGPITSNVFRFIGIRPPELVTDSESLSRFIHDDRISDVIEKRLLSSNVYNLARGNPVRAWEVADKDRVTILFQLYVDVRRYYRDLQLDWVDDGTPVPDGADLLTLMNADGAGMLEGMEPEEEHQIWDLLYTAYAIGCDSGNKVELPLSALRLTHFYRSLDREPAPSPSEALRILDTMVLVDPMYREQFTSARRDASQDDENEPDPQTKQRTKNLVTLARDVIAASQLLDSVQAATAPVNFVPLKRVDTPDWGGRVEGGNVPTASDVIPGKITADQKRVLDALGIQNNTSAPAMYGILSQQMRDLQQVVEQVQNEPEFQQAYQTLSTKQAKVTLSSGEFIGDLKTPIGLQSAADQIATQFAPQYDMTGRIRPLGIGDLLVVKQTLLAYVAGEVAHIENVLNGEEKSRNHRRLDRTEVTIFEATEENKESERDTQTTNRFELESEVDKTIQTETSFAAGVKVTGKYGPVETTVTGDFATKNAKEESSKSSTKYSKELVDKTLTKIQSKVRSERTTKTITEVEEINIHSLAGRRPDGGHTVGIYRWVDKKYRAQVYNYGLRLMLEFIVPEPATYYRKWWLQGKDTSNIAALKPPDLKRYYDKNGTDIFQSNVIGLKDLTPEHITETNYFKYANKFGVTGVEPIPPLYTTVSTTINTPQHIELGKSFTVKADDKFIVPEGYTLYGIDWAASGVWDNGGELALHVLGRIITIQNEGTVVQLASNMGRTDGTDTITLIAETDPWPHFTELNNSLPAALVGYDVVSAAVTLVAYCKRTDRAEEVWSSSVYKAIREAWQNQQKAYEQALAEEGQRADNAQLFQGQNPGINKKVLENELKKHCITMMAGTDSNAEGAMSIPQGASPTIKPYEALSDGRISQFFEQAFEWEQMTYLFYPYYWGLKTRWKEYQHLTDSDPLFQSFLTAGAARVVVPVPLEYACDVRYLLTNPHGYTELGRKVWRGGDMPDLNDPTYRSIADELRQQTDDLYGAEPYGTSWEYKIPTTLVWLQQEDSLPKDMDKPE